MVGGESKRRKGWKEERRSKENGGNRLKSRQRILQIRVLGETGSCKEDFKGKRRKEKSKKKI